MDIVTFITNFEAAIDGITPGSVAPETAFRELPQWDSLAYLSLLAMIDAEYGVEVPGDRIDACNSVAELFEVVRSVR